MSYLYVSSVVGTGGNRLTQQTGAFSGLTASDVYADRDAALVDAIAVDIICISDAHSDTPASGDVLLTGTSSGDGIYITAVDDDNCDVEVQAATVQETATDDVMMSGQLVIQGLNIDCDDNIVVNSGSRVHALGCDFSVSGAADYLLFISGDGSSIIAENCTLTGTASSRVFNIASGGIITMYGGSVSGPPNLTDGGFFSGGGLLRLHGVDLSGITSTLFANIGSDLASDDTIDIVIDGCKLNASYTFLNEQFTKYGHVLRVTNSAPSSVLAEYQFHLETCSGYLTDQSDSGIHRDESTAFPSGTKVSAKCYTYSTCSISKPFVMDLLTRFAELSASTGTVRVYLTCATTLTDKDVHISVMHPNSTNKHLWDYVSSRPNMLASGTELTADTGSTWKNGVSDLSAYNEYYIDVDTGVSGDSDCVPILMLTVTKDVSSNPIYFDTSIGIVA